MAKGTVGGLGPGLRGRVAAPDAVDPGAWAGLLPGGPFAGGRNAPRSSAPVTLWMAWGRLAVALRRAASCAAHGFDGRTVVSPALLISTPSPPVMATAPSAEPVRCGGR